MDINYILQILGSILGGGGIVWGIWRFIQPKLTPNAKRDTIIEDLIKQIHIQSMPGDASGPSVPDRATALQYTEAVLRYMEKHGSKEGVDALVIVLSQIAAPSVPLTPKA